VPSHRALLHRHPLLVIDGRLQVEGAVLDVSRCGHT